MQCRAVLGMVFVLSLAGSGVASADPILFFEGLSEKIEEKIHEKFPDRIRLDHAQELLGKYYDRSIVSRSEALTIASFVDESVVKALPKKWKEQSSEIAKTVLDLSEKYGFDPVFLLSVIQNESSFRPAVRGPVGEIGLMQLRMRTGKWMAERISMKWEGEKTLLDPVKNIQLGAAYLDYLRNRFDRHSRLYLSAYNMGSMNVKRALRKKIWPKDYVQAVMRRYVEFYQDLVRVRPSRGISHES